MKRRYLILLIVLSALTLVSLVIHGVVIAEFLRLRCASGSIVADARALLTELENETFSYTVEVDQEVPISARVPFREAVTVPINTVIPISTTVVVPINLRFTTYNLAVPIDTVIPVDIEVTVPFSETVDVVTAVPIDVDVPVDITISETPLVDYLRQLNAMLQEVETYLGCPGWQE